jgi:hypothetical protein
MKYTVQRPQIVWIETEVIAPHLSEALRLADEDFESGNYFTLDTTWENDYNRYWVQDENGNQFTETHHSAPATN